MSAGRPKSFPTAADLQAGIDAYFAECKESNIEKAVGGVVIRISEPVTVSGLAHALGVSRETLHTYAAGEYDSESEEYSDAIKKAVAYIERDKVSKAMLGVYDRTISIFDLKNNHGWRDQKEMKLDARLSHTSELTDEQLERIASGGGTGVTG